MNIPPENLEICLQVLQQISEDPALINNHERFKSLIAKIYKNGRKGIKKENQEQRKAADEELKSQTVIVQNQIAQQSFTALPPATKFINGQLNKPINCYICKKPYTEIHFFYHSLCPQCAQFNYEKRHQSTDLNGRVALVTGGRIKIGYQTALKMLRDGARVIVTTRFPRDCMRRFSQESDFENWHSRLQIHGLDLRQIPAVEAFVHHLFTTESCIDIIINNAAQTVKRPLAFYQHLLAQEEESGNFLLESQPEYNHNLATIQAYFPQNTFDRDGQQLDLRPLNSWLLKLDEVSTLEMLEVQLVNNIAPFILNSQLKPLMMKSKFPRRFIINVSAMEGQFNRESKTIYHPHTNMAKAALNMMTRTSASDYAQDGIYMNSVDTGWITDENPYPKKSYLQENRGFYTPLDIIDGMARIYDPIVQGIKNSDEPIYGQFLKDYFPHPW
ncbi:MAG TPA: SDR family oxidoreductase [Nostocaceae cyanobacterium]|nr:SDR family oxidoreductase [Nostocaceae cyanobacterium]